MIKELVWSFMLINGYYLQWLGWNLKFANVYENWIWDKKKLGDFNYFLRM